MPNLAPDAAVSRLLDSIRSRKINAVMIFLLGAIQMTEMPLPMQFQENEAWIVFKLNTLPILTKQDGDFNCFALMDAASGLILGNCFVSVLDAQMPAREVDELLAGAHGQRNAWPTFLMLSVEQELGVLIEHATRAGIAVRRVPESQLEVFVGPAREGFRQHFGGGGLH